MQTILIATIKEWNIKNYFILKEKYQEKFQIELITNPEELTIAYINKLDPKYIFFPHWSWIIPKEIYQNYECVVFHMTDLPFGRGGSPLQNLIVNQIYDTKITALRVDEGIDSGDIYFQIDFNIEFGSAQEIFEKGSDLTFQDLIPKFLESSLYPQKQIGKITTFKRRTPDQSNLQNLDVNNLKRCYDFIRMLDANGYPKAFLELNNLKIEFYQVKIEGNKLIGQFEVKENEK